MRAVTDAGVVAEARAVPNAQDRVHRASRVLSEDRFIGASRLVGKDRLVCANRPPGKDWRVRVSCVKCEECIQSASRLRCE